MRVAVIQMAPKLKELDYNLRTAASLVRTALTQGSEMVVLPELMTTGYSFMSNADAFPYAEDLTSGEGPSMRIFGRLAAESGATIVWGVMEVEHGKLYNSQVLVKPDGHHIKCRKLNSWGNDYLWSTPGTDSPPITIWRGKKVGLLICADIRDKSESIDDFYEPGDADLVAFSANWGSGGGFPSGRWVKFAQSNNVTLLVSNRYGDEAHNSFGEGGICVIEPSGKVHCEGLKWNEPCIVYSDVP